MKFKVNHHLIESLSETEVKNILQSVTVDNPRYNYEQFTKYFGDDVIWVGDKNALAALKKNHCSNNDTYITEIQSFTKGAGKQLINNILKQYHNVWLMCDPSANDTLKNYYRQFDMKELQFGKDNIWHTEVSLFYKGDDRLKDSLINYFDTTFGE